MHKNYIIGRHQQKKADKALTNVRRRNIWEKMPLSRKNIEKSRYFVIFDFLELSLKILASEGSYLDIVYL